MPQDQAHRFAGKTVLVTGGSRGQGAAQAQAFAREGAAVVIADILDRDGAALAADITSAGGRAHYQRLDVSSEADWRAAATHIRDDTGALHVLVNCAGIALRKPSLLDTELAEWEKVLAVNLTGPFLGLRALAPIIRDSGGGAVVNVGSSAGMTGHFAAAYSASKWGLRGLTKAAAMEFAEWNIRVNAVHPNIVRTPMVENSPDFIEAMTRAAPLGRAAEPDDIAAVVQFLASDEARYLTGLDIAADGGFTELGAYRAVLKQVQQAPQKL